MSTRDERGSVLGGVALREICTPTLQTSGRTIATPAYVYDLDAMEAEARALSAGFGATPHLVAYAVKANSAGPIVRALGRAGCGAEIVSGGELTVALGCGIAPSRVLLSGVAKQAWEIDRAVGA